MNFFSKFTQNTKNSLFSGLTPQNDSIISPKRREAEFLGSLWQTKDVLRIWRQLNSQLKSIK